MRLSIATKYPVAVVALTLITSIIISAILLNVSIQSLTTEIKKRGTAIAQGFASANSAAMLMFVQKGAEEDTAILQLNINNLSQNPDVIEAWLINHRNKVLAARNPADVGKQFTQSDLQKKLTKKFARNKGFKFEEPLSFGGTKLGTFVLVLSRKPLDDAIKEASIKVGLFSIIIIIILSVIIFAVMRKTLKPIKLINKALAKIASGNFSQRINLKRNDEIGDLVVAFNSMTARAELFFSYVDRTIVERLIDNPALAKPGGRLKELTVLFGDMRGYTTMSNRRSANDVVSIINTYFYLFIDIVSLFDGFVDKTMGDAIMAVFERNEENSEAYKQRGVLAAAHMKAASTILNTFLKHRIQEGERFQQEARDFGFAIASGKAILGNIGSPRRMDYSVCGRIVNLASRLEKETQHGEVIMDNFCRMGCEAILSYESLAPVQPKGFAIEEKVLPHRVTNLYAEESLQLRTHLKELFRKEFFKDYLVPDCIEEPNEIDKWVDTAWQEVQDLIETTPTENLFALAHSDS